MKVKIRDKVIALLFAVLFVLNAPAYEVKAAESISTHIKELPCTIIAVNELQEDSFTRATTFSDARINVSCSSAGMSITIFTNETKQASVIGVKDIVIERKVGFWWETVATASGDEVYNATGCALNLTYADAVYDETYRISCVHYADVDGYRELEHTTGNIIFTY